MKKQWKENLGKQNDFYEELFSRKETDGSLINFFIENLNSSFNKSEQDFLIQDFNQNEIFQTIKSFASLKTPGKDSLPIEFYKFAWESLEEDFTKVIDKVSRNFELPESWNKWSNCVNFQKR